MDRTIGIDLHRMLADARRRRGLTQAELARQADCRQSAVSMMERGRSDALSWSKIEAIGAILEVDVAVFAPKTSTEEVPALLVSAAGYCPQFDCPANIPYVVNGRLYALPRITSTGKFCQYCGELLEKSCPECGAKIDKASACCQQCGSSYVATPDDFVANNADWVDKQRAMIRDIG
jgi:transcriptional regulator with XRE-family HTH domain